MKQILAVFIAAMLLTGCSSEKIQQETDSSAAPQETILQEQTQGEEKLKKPLTITIREENMDGYDAETGEIKLLDFSYPCIQIENETAPEAAVKITEFLERENSKFITGKFPEGDLYASVGQEMAIQYAKEHYEMFKEDFYPCSAERTCSIVRGDERILSLSLIDYLYSGGAHGSLIEKTYNFDLQTGNQLHLEDLSQQPDDFKTYLLERMTEQAERVPEIKDSINWYEPDEYGEAFSALLRDGSWSLGSEYLTIRSLEYELGSYAAGPVAFKIPIEDLRFYLKEAYLPEATEEGSLRCAEKTELPIAAEYSRGENGVPVYLETDGSVYEISIRELNWYPDGSDCIEGKLLFYCGELQDSALSLNVIIPEVMPDLMVSYRTAGGVIHKGALTQSGEDGHYFLMDLNE